MDLRAAQDGFHNPFATRYNQSVSLDTEPVAAAIPETKDSVSGSVAAPQSPLVNLASGTPPEELFSIDSLIKGFEWNFKSQDPSAVSSWLQYGPGQGHKAYLESLAKFLTSQYGHEVLSQHLWATAAVTHGLGMLLEVLVRPGDIILVEDPTFFLTTSILQHRSKNIVPVATDEWGIIPERLETLLEFHNNAEALARTNNTPAQNRPPKIRMLYCIPSFNNPRGSCLPRERREKLVQLAERYDFWLVCDEIYQLLHFPDVPPPVPMAQLSKRVISLSSFSKILAPGIRVGWIHTTNQDVLDSLRGNAVNYTGGAVCQFSSGIVRGAMEQGLIMPAVERARKLLSDRCAMMVAELKKSLPETYFTVPSGGYFVWLNFPAEIDVSSLALMAESEFKVKILPGYDCGIPEHGNDIQEYVRVSLRDEATKGLMLVGQRAQFANCARLCFARSTPEAIQSGIVRLAQALHAYKARHPHRGSQSVFTFGRK